MIVHEIRRFGICAGEYRDIFFDAPCSVAAALSEAGIVGGVSYEEKCAAASSLIAGGCTLTAEFIPDIALISKDSVVLSLDPIDAPVTVLIGGMPIANVEPGHSVHRLNIKTLLRGGKNRIELRVGALEPKRGRFPDIILGAPRVEAYDDRIIDAVSVRQTESGDGVDVDLSITTVGYGTDSRAVATLVSPSGSVNYASFVNGKAKVHIQSPSRWWPGKLGAHSLYRLSINLYSNGEVADSRDGVLGIRNLSVLTDEYGESLISVSGAAFAPIGAVLTQADILSPLNELDRARRAVERAAMCGINAVYLKDELPSQRLLTACDELGVCVILKLSQKIPESGAERTVALRELARVFSTYSLHPSLAVVTASRENAEAVSSIVSQMLPDTAFIPDFKIHTTDWIPTMPAEATLSEFVPEGERNIFSPSMVKCTVGDVALLVSHISREHLMPYGTEEIRYVSGIVSSASFKERYIDAIRKEKKGGILIPSLIDPKPYFSPSLIDYRLRPKTLWYYISRLSRPTIASAAVYDTRVEFFGYNLQRNVYRGKLSYALVDTRGTTLIRDSVDVIIPAATSASLLSVDFAELIGERKDNAVLMYTLSGSDGVFYSDTALFVSERELKLYDPKVKYDLIGACNDFTLTLNVDAYARAVEVTFFDEDVILSDNYFDITPSIPVRIDIKSPRPTAIESLWNKIKIRSLYDVGRG